jgi:protein disulfide-isomerase
MKLLTTLILTSLVATATATFAADGPYNESADAKLDIKNALASAKDTPVLVVFGANWCPDCNALDKAMKKGSTAELLAKDFKIVKVDVGQKDKNLDVAKTYGVPIEKGIPTVAVLSSKAEVLYVMKGGELASARSMSEDGIYEFFKKVTASTKKKE